MSHGRTTTTHLDGGATSTSTILAGDKLQNSSTISVAAPRNKAHRSSLQPANSTSKLVKRESGGDIGHVMERGQEGTRMREILKKLSKEEVAQANAASVQPSGRGKNRPNMHIDSNGRVPKSSDRSHLPPSIKINSPKISRTPVQDTVIKASAFDPDRLSPQ